MNALLNSTVYQSNGTCSKLERFAFSSHSSCYVDNGFCSDILLNATNLYCVSRVFDYSDFFNRRAIQQVNNNFMLLSFNVSHRYTIQQQCVQVRLKVSCHL